MHISEVKETIRSQSKTAFLHTYPQPALVLEPLDMQGEIEFDTSKFPTLAELETACTDEWSREQMTSELGTKVEIDPNAQVHWLVKSDRNPFAGVITLGRARNNDIVVRQGSVSKLHAMFYREGEAWSVEDRESTNGTILDGVKLPPLQKRAVEGD